MGDTNFLAMTSALRGTTIRLAGALALLGVLLLGVGCGGDTESLLAEVRALHQAGDFASSIEPLRGILATEPDHEEANLLLGLALVQTKQPSLAIWPLRKASQSESHGLTAKLLLAATMLQTEGFEEAIATTDEILAVSPDHIGALTIRLQSDMGVGREEDALLDADRLLELEPQNLHALAARATLLAQLERVDEAEAVWIELDRIGRESGDPAMAVRGCVSLVAFYASVGSDKTAAAVESCLDEHPGNADVVQVATQYWDQQEQPEKATSLLENAIESAPDDYGLRLKLAQRLDRLGEAEKAEAVLLEAAELFDDATAWARLAYLRAEHDDAEGALESLDRALERAPAGSEPLLFRKADLLMQTGDIDAAEAIGEQLENESYRALVRGLVLAARGDDEGALEAYEAGLARWPDNAGARNLAGQAAERLGLRAKALSHYREAVRADKAGTDAALSAALILLADGKFQDAAEMAHTQALNRPFLGPEAFRANVRALIALGLYEPARKTLDSLALIKGQEVIALVERAALERVAEGPAEAAAVVENSGLDLTDSPNSAALASLADDLIALGRSDEALRRVDAALAVSPEDASLYDMRGRVLFARGELAQARAAFERAVELDAESLRARTALALLAMQEGRLDEALSQADRAAANDPDGDAAYLAAQIVAGQGRSDEAVDRLRALLKEHPGHAMAANDLAWNLAERGESLPQALELAKRAVRLEEQAGFLDTLGWVHLKQGDALAAVEAFERALALDASAVAVRYRLGLALQELGRTSEALEALRQAVDGGTFPELERAEAEIARLEAGAGEVQ